VERELLNAGVLPENIEIKGKGATSKFDIKPNNPLAEANLRANRRIVVNADTSNIPPKPVLPPPDPAPADLTPAQRLERFKKRQHQMVDTAVAIVTGGHYRLAADAYMSRWTCGEFRTLREAVARTEVRIEGDPEIGGPTEVGGLSGGEKGLETEKEPFDIVILNQAMFKTVDPMSCLIARIIDLTFHLKTRPHLAGRNKRHLGGLFLVNLAGFPPCADRVPGGSGETRNWFEGDPPASDPLANEPLPPCAEKPLEGAWASEKEARERGHDLGGKKPLEFAPATLLSVTDSVEPASFRADLQTNRAFLGTSGDQDGHPRVIATSKLEAHGDAALFPRYQLGFIRTVQEDETVVEYVNGFHLRRSLPTPLRDGSPSDPAPWFDAGSMQQPGPPDAPAVLETAAPPTPPQLEFPFAILTHPDVTARAGAEQAGGTGPIPPVDLRGRLPIDPMAENVVSRVQRRVLYTLWTAARRDDSPLDRADTRFLEAQQVTVREKVDVRIAPSGDVRPSGDARVNGQDAGPGLEGFARLDGPVPAAFAAGDRGFALGDIRVVRREMPQDRDVTAEGLELDEYRERVVDLTDPIRKDLGLTQALTMNILIDRRSGRMRVPGIEAREGTGLVAAGPVMTLPVQVLVDLQDGNRGPFAPRSVLDTLAERFYLQTRRFLVLQRGTGEQAQGGSNHVVVNLRTLADTPQSFRHLHEEPAARPFFREVWNEFAKDCRLERSASIIVDRRTGKMRRVFRVGGQPRVVGNQIVHSVEVCVNPAAGGDNHLDVHETVLGTVHAHPHGIAPSLNDYDLVREMEGLESLGGVAASSDVADQLTKQRLCGNELYTLLRDAHGDVIAIRMGTEPGKDAILGPILGDIKGC
jgi:hypothetical protein